MSAYADILNVYLKNPERREIDFAAAIGATQASVNRWRNGKRFPDAKTAKAIDAETRGRVSFAVWQSEFLKRSGLGNAA